MYSQSTQSCSSVGCIEAKTFLLNKNCTYLKSLEYFSLKFVKSDSCVSSESLDEKGKSKKNFGIRDVCLARKELDLVPESHGLGARMYRARTPSRNENF